MDPMENEMASIQHVSKTENTSWSCFVIVTLGGNSVPKEFSLNHHKDLRDSQKTLSHMFHVIMQYLPTFGLNLL